MLSVHVSVNFSGHGLLESIRERDLSSGSVLERFLSTFTGKLSSSSTPTWSRTRKWPTAAATPGLPNAQASLCRVATKKGRCSFPFCPSRLDRAIMVARCPVRSWRLRVGWLVPSDWETPCIGPARATERSPGVLVTTQSMSPQRLRSAQFWSSCHWTWADSRLETSSCQEKFFHSRSQVKLGYLLSITLTEKSLSNQHSLYKSQFVGPAPNPRPAIWPAGMRPEDQVLELGDRCVQVCLVGFLARWQTQFFSNSRLQRTVLRFIGGLTFGAVVGFVVFSKSQNNQFDLRLCEFHSSLLIFVNNGP